ncbi:DUF4265 domain-containing protein [Kribbella sp. NBC_01245]|uniref:DUF4265 domain-containing protein n=1 Tax=Kribbella sp. NBC_01245 TaxID=2903578 RepID=UPI002E2B00E2|nr:DUF4265 domain-containing protein [Kribbella sp. NBC_01245]
MTTTLHIKLAQDGSGWPPYDSEEVAVEKVGEDEYRLLTPPMFAKGLAVGDVVHAHEYGDPPVPWIASLVSSSGHSTIRVITRLGFDEEATVARLTAAGLALKPTTLLGLHLADLPAERQYGPILAELATLADAGQIDFEEAALSPSHAEAL